jgi:hypothetical protein
MENQLAESLQTYRDIIENNKRIALSELELCDTLEKCYEWKKKYLGKKSVINQILQSVSGKFEEL